MSKRRKRLPRRAARSGLRFGAWSVWLVVDDEELLFIHRPTGWTARVVVGSNGWFDFRAEDGSWHTVYSNSDIEPDDGDSEPTVTEFRVREPASDWPAGEFHEQEWRFETDAVRLLVHHEGNDGPLVLYRDRPLWTWGKKPLIAPVV